MFYLYLKKLFNQCGSIYLVIIHNSISNMAEYMFNPYSNINEFCQLLDDDEDKRSSSSGSGSTTSTASTAATFKSEIIIEINTAIKAVPKAIQKPLHLMSDAIDCLRTNQKTIFGKLEQHKRDIDKTNRRITNVFGNNRENDLSTSLEMLCANYLRRIFKKGEFTLKYQFGEADGGKDEIDIFGIVQERETKLLIIGECTLSLNDVLKVKKAIRKKKDISKMFNVSEKNIKLYIFAHRLGEESRKEVIEKINKHGILLKLSHELLEEKNLGSQENKINRFCCCQ